MFDEKTRTAIQVNTNNFGDGLAGRGLGLNNTIADAAAAGDERDPRAAQPRRAADRPARAVHRARPRRLADRPGGRRQRRRTGATRTPSSRRGRASRPRSKKRPWADRRRSNRRSTRFPTRRPSTKTRTEFMRLLRPSASALLTVAPPLAHAFTVGAVNLRRRHRAEHAAGRILAGAGGIRREPGRHARARRLHRRRSKSATRCSPGIAPEQANCNYFTLAFRNVASLESENVGVGTLARAGFVLAPNGPEQRGLPVLGARRTGRRSKHRPTTAATIIDNNHAPREPLPERRRSRPAAAVRSRQRDLHARESRDRQPAGERPSRRAANSRPAKQNLFGEKYPSSTLQDAPRRCAKKGKSE